jgi:2-polyprenyl-3-methyl-5-hydroxy-6-metoxy-1,4-benzoquinol methylase
MTHHKTLYGLDVETQWDQILESHVLALAKEHKPDWYRWRLTNNFERAVFLNGDPVLPRETTRYLWANQNLLGESVFEVGCSTGFGSQFLPKNTKYLGIDYDPLIINVAKDQRWGANRYFQCADVNSFNIPEVDTIIAFEVIEHLDNGLELIDTLKSKCSRLLLTTPWKEPKGFWGEHHKLHDLDEQLFPDFQISYINEHGFVSRIIEPISAANKCNLMLLRWDRV